MATNCPAMMQNLNSQTISCSFNAQILNMNFLDAGKYHICQLWSDIRKGRCPLTPMN